MVLDYESEIEILLNEQKKIVSYKELCHRYNITPFEAKCILQNYLSKHGNQKSKLFSTYLIHGKDKSKKMRICLVNEEDLEGLKDIEILSKQVYSIQCTKLDDFNVFCSHDIGSSTNSNIKLSNKLRTSVLTNTNVTANNDDDDLIQAEKMVNLKLSKSNSSLAVKSEPVKNERTEMSKENKESEPKKIKTEPAVIEPTSVKEPATKKVEASKPQAKKNQATLTSFFKKV